MSIRRVRNIIFLKDVSVLSLTAFGGPQGHFGMFLDLFVSKRGYLTEEDLIELYALCQVLPGPTSTQTITALGYKIGGPNLAYLTLFVWAFPAVSIMTAFAIFVTCADSLNISLDFLRFIEPIAVGIVAYSSYKIAVKVVNTKVGFGLMIISAIASYTLKSPYAFPSLIILGGLATTWRYKSQPIEEKEKININWSNLILWISVLIAAAVLGGVTQYQPIKTFENFYRNGSLIFGGGQVLVPLLYTEFVEFKEYLTSQEFISGYGFVQAIPGPVFSFSGYVGAVTEGGSGIGAQLIGIQYGCSWYFSSWYVFNILHHSILGATEKIQNSEGIARRDYSSKCRYGYSSSFSSFYANGAKGNQFYSTVQYSCYDAFY